jgi:integrase
MGTIREVETSLGTLYERHNSKGEVIQQIGIIGFVKEYEGKVYFIITKLNGERIKEANIFLNDKIMNADYRKREGAFTALKHFYSFLELYHIEDYKKGLSNENVNKLITFLEGGKSEGNMWDIEFETQRRNITINHYLASLRQFYNLMSFDTKNPLFDKNILSYRSTEGITAKRETVERYAANKKVKIVETPPMYIKPKEYERMIEIVEEKYSLRDKVILELMYRYGCRLGEVLGLTLEDFEKSEHSNGANIKITKYRLIIRNRLSDKPWQKAKKPMSIISPTDYEKPEYKQLGVGYQVITIDEEMAELLEEYNDESRNEFLLNQSDIKRNNLNKKAIADRVSDYPLTNGENQYIFLNEQHYTPLTAAGWSYTLRKLFKEVGIKLDKGVKVHNLSHRFRHGFAMYKKKYEGYDELLLADALRHSGTETVKRYFRPDEEDQVEIKEIQRNDMRERGYSL